MDFGHLRVASSGAN